MNLEIGATQNQIKKAYFSLVRKYHPDSHPDEFMKIREAYETLSNAKTRREYDGIIELPPMIKLIFENSREAFSIGDYYTAIEHLEEIKDYAPDSSLIRDLLGQAYLENDNTGKAIKVFQGLVEEYPDNAAFAGHLGDAYLFRGWHKKARVVYKKAAELDDNNISVWLGWSQTCSLAEDYEAQRQVLIRALELEKERGWESSVLYTHAIHNDLSTGNMDDVEDKLDRLMEITLAKKDDMGSFVATSLFELANVLIDGGWFDLAKVIVDNASKLITDDKYDEGLSEAIKEAQFDMQQIIRRNSLLDDFMNDENIRDEVRELVAVEVIPGYMDDADISPYLFTLMTESYIAFEIQQFLSSIHVLKEKYPELYEVKKSYFDILKNPTKKKRLIRRHEKAIRKYESEEDNSAVWDEPLNQPYVRDEPKVGRNDPCPCGSGKKYKKCCGR